MTTASLTSRCIGPPPASGSSSSPLPTSRRRCRFSGASAPTSVPGDYDGDRKTDLAVFRPGTTTWFIKQSTTGYTTSVSFQWGLSGDVPTRMARSPMRWLQPRRMAYEARQSGARQRFRRRWPIRISPSIAVHRHVVHPAVKYQLHDVDVFHTGPQHRPAGHGRLRW